MPADRNSVEEDKMTESKYATQLRERGFVPDPNLTKGKGSRKGPFFLASPPGSEPITLATDETGMVWVCQNRSMDLSSLGFVDIWHPVLTPLRMGFMPAPDFPEKEKLELPAYFNWDFDGAHITMAVDENGKCWQAYGEIDLSRYGFFEHDHITWKKVTTH